MMWSLLRRLGVVDPNLVNEVSDLKDQVVDLTLRLASSEESKVQMRRDLKAACRQKVLSAYEPEVAGACRKVRYLHEEDAVVHATGIANKEWGVWFAAYQCRRCPPYPSWGTLPWHAGHSRSDDPAAFYVNRGVVTYTCGCAWGIDTQEELWVCESHKVVVDA